MVFLPITFALLSNGCFLAETLLKSSILLIFMALTCIVSHMHAPMFLVQLFSTFTFLRIQNSLELVPLRLPFPVAFSVLSFVAFSLTLEFAQRTPNSLLTLWGSDSWLRSY
jgi:hypothetical protein